MTITLRRAVAVGVLALSQASCSLMPDYQRPALPVADDWSRVAGYPPASGEQLAADSRWQDFFTDPDLQRVIQAALTNNRDLRTAALTIDEARQVYRVSRADLLPAIDLAGQGAIGETSDASSVTGDGARTELYTATVGLSSYELDLFGRVRSRNEAALNDYLATGEAYAVVRNALIAEVANAYLQYLADKNLLQLTEKTLTAQLSSLDLLTKSRDRGVATQQDVSRAETAVETARVNLHQYRRFVVQDRNALFLLMGVAHDDGLLPETTLDTLVLPDNLNPGLPADVLLSRPDVRQAERALMARNADIGAARAAFFPSIRLTGDYGYASGELDDLFSGNAFGAWNFLPSITVPIFQGGRNQANLALAELRRDQAIVQYEKVVQTAFREVADELAAHATLERQSSAQNRLVRAARKVYDLSNARYHAGIDSFLSVLDAQRELYAAEINAIAIERQRLANLVNLYKVLGGGA